MQIKSLLKNAEHRQQGCQGGNGTDLMDLRIHPVDYCMSRLLCVSLVSLCPPKPLHVPSRHSRFFCNQIWVTSLKSIQLNAKRSFTGHLLAPLQPYFNSQGSHAALNTSSLL